jgi:hypothetical protein
VRLEGLGQFKNPMTSSGIESQPSGLQHSSSTIYATACPRKTLRNQKSIGFKNVFDISVYFFQGSPVVAKPLAVTEQGLMIPDIFRV